MKGLILYVVMVAMLIVIFFVGMIGREAAIKNQCTKKGEVTMIIGNPWLCRTITHHKTLESAKAQVSSYQAMVRG